MFFMFLLKCKDKQFFVETCCNLSTGTVILVGYEELPFHDNTSSSGPGYLSQCSDLLRAGRSGDRIPVRARFSAPV